MHILKFTNLYTLNICIWGHVDDTSIKWLELRERPTLCGGEEVSESILLSARAKFHGGTPSLCRLKLGHTVVPTYPRSGFHGFSYLRSHVVRKRSTKNYRNKQRTRVRLCAAVRSMPASQAIPLHAAQDASLRPSLWCVHVAPATHLSIP